MISVALFSTLYSTDQTKGTEKTAAYLQRYGSVYMSSKGPVISADSEKSTSYRAKLELKKGVFSAPCKRPLKTHLLPVGG